MNTKSVFCVSISEVLTFHFVKGAIFTDFLSEVEDSLSVKTLQGTEIMIEKEEESELAPMDIDNCRRLF